MKITWKNNGTTKTFFTTQKGWLKSLKKQMRKNVVQGSDMDKAIASSCRLADVHWAIYGAIGTKAFEEFIIESE